MAALDVRTKEDKEITEIIFDGTTDRIIKDSCGLTFLEGDEERTFCLCRWDDLEDFIAAIREAEKLWGPKKGGGK